MMHVCVACEIEGVKIEFGVLKPVFAGPPEFIEIFFSCATRPHGHRVPSLMEHYKKIEVGCTVTTALFLPRVSCVVPLSRPVAHCTNNLFFFIICQDGLATAFPAKLPYPYATAFHFLPSEPVKRATE